MTDGATLRDRGMQQVEEASDDWARATVDQAIRAVAEQGRPFSANDWRPLLPEGIRPALIGARVMAASKRGEIRRVGWVASTDPGTHSHPISLWMSAEVQAEVA